jgi:hypothetical protein
MRVNFKFRAGSAPSSRASVLAALREAGAASVQPLFPGEKDPELAELYVADGAERLQAKLIALLQRRREVEFAEPEPVRRLIKKVRTA